jgi:hypothetical protein
MNVCAHRCRHYAVYMLAIILASFATAILGIGLVPAAASLPGASGTTIKPQVTSIAAAPDGGFWIQKMFPQECPPDCAITSPGNTSSRAGAPLYENIDQAGLIAWAPGTNGYWVVTPQGKIHPRGGAPHLCNGDLSTCSGFVPVFYGQIMAVAATPTGLGFWAVGYDGKVWTAGDAHSYGDAQNAGAAATGIAATPSGHGYCISLADGGVYCRGDAPFFGSHPDTTEFTTGITFSFDQNGNVNGYWLVNEDGGVFTYGAATLG